MIDDSFSRGRRLSWTPGRFCGDGEVILYCENCSPLWPLRRQQVRRQCSEAEVVVCVVIRPKGLGALVTGVAG